MEYFITFKILKEGAIPLLTWEDLLRHSQGGKKRCSQNSTHNMISFTKKGKHPLCCVQNTDTLIYECIVNGLEKQKSKESKKSPKSIEELPHM